MKKEISDLLEKVFDIDIEDTDRDKLVEEIFDWDSYMIMNLLVEIQNQFHRKPDLAGFFNVKTVEDLIELIGETIDQG